MTKQELLSGEWFTIKSDIANAYKYNAKIGTVERYTSLVGKTWVDSKSHAGQIDLDRTYDNCFLLYTILLGQLVQLEVQLSDCTVFTPEIR